MADDISRRIDDLLSGAIDEQVREQRVLNDMLVGVRDGVSRLVGDVAALSARVTESRETSQGLREELPFLVQREVGSAVNAFSVRIDVLETAVGELVASLAGLEDRVGPEVVISGVAERLDALRAQESDDAGRATADAAATAIDEASADIRALYQAEAASTRAAFEQAAGAIADAVEKNHTQLAKKLAEVKKWSDHVDARIKALEKALEGTAKMPGEVRQQLNELTGATQDMTESMLEEIRANSEAAASRLGATVEGVDAQAIDMSRRFAEMTDQVRAFRDELLAYLQVRDLALEERRDQVVTELLGDFLSEMPVRERERAAGRLRGVLERRRDRRDAGRYRTGAAPATLPAVSPEAAARAKAEVERERHPVPERAWSERAWQSESLTPEAPAPAPIPYEEPPERPAPAAQKPAAKPKASARASAKPKAAPKKKTAKAAPKKKASKPAADEAPVTLSSLLGGDEEPEEMRRIVDVARTEGEIDVFDIEAFASVGDTEEVKAASSAAKEKPAAKPRSRKRAQPEAPEQPEPAPSAETIDATEAGEPAAAAPVESDDTLSQALARVQALVDSHRKPGAARRRGR